MVLLDQPANWCRGADRGILLLDTSLAAHARSCGSEGNRLGGKYPDHRRRIDDIARTRLWQYHVPVVFGDRRVPYSLRARDDWRLRRERVEVHQKSGHPTTSFHKPLDNRCIRRVGL